MTAARKLNRITIADYLAGELASPVKHEYVGGSVYAMVGSRNVHNRIAGNTFGSLFVRLRGKPCQPYNSGTKIRVSLPTETRFYYPDVSVVCVPNPATDSFQDEPAAIFEVLSKGTRRLDEGEKKDAYLTIPSLGVYVLIEQDAPLVTVYRRMNGTFSRETYDDLNATVMLGEIGTELPLAKIYEGVEFVPETAEA
jgi:Uma2 family endonuclease